jgi:fumarate hydratase subunit beta
LLKGEKTAIDFKGSGNILRGARAGLAPGKIIGSIGPTTSYRMDFFTPKLIENGLKGMIGKGGPGPRKLLPRSKKYGAVLFRR